MKKKMAKATICDICGHILEYACDCKITIYTHPYGDMTYELCDKCKDELQKWMKSSRFNEFRAGGKNNET